MRKFTLSLLAVAAVFAAGTANAADLPRKAPPMVVPAPVFTWTGFYLGINGGYGWASTKNGFTEFDDASGGVFGVQGGFNYQFVGSPIVIGIEADYQGANIKADGTLLAGPPRTSNWSGSAPSAAASASPGIAS